MTEKRNDFDPAAYNPTFKWDFLAPKYWGTWLGVFVGIPLVFFPQKTKHWLSCKLAKYTIKKPSRTINNAWINFGLCFPEKSDEEKEQLLEKTLITAVSFLLNFASLSLRSQKWLTQNTTIHGINNIHETLEQGHKAILLVPHSWGIDIPAIYLASQGLPVSAMAKRQKNPVTDWLMHKQRVQYGGRVYERDNGIKPFIKSVRDGYLGYYLPDQDHGREHSIFVDFFNVSKATLPGLGKLSKVSRAKIIPVFSNYDAQTGQFSIDVLPAWEDYPSQSDHQDTQRMNQFIEGAVRKRPEQYMWVLRFLTTQPDPENTYNPYEDRELWLKTYTR
ncbi:lauroyl-Kdo(2)-lipid IV(A) myristoyltransferase [Vibrio splendidus]|uniref:lauroyl-Kdo(2)-lipid IV(A) myristoyltransferase n=1 Tax=Vibrio splendidus TaxID=29497 RepID=UPI000C862DB0|nr:lauroyl-Kdo(2)-lipid IV(A) myristoyltransferase [Vibrio splendidus]MCW4446373.1 lauroyl-Kdo(2)-lipid IV(A) myristoyltransferase [Vibrio splendidus]PMG26078.1 lipid A biosynthesis (KDO)2-(lauroyl)-lipid IVA acyltransferase [Vibrio splendidus]